RPARVAHSSESRDEHTVPPPPCLPLQPAAPRVLPRANLAIGRSLLAAARTCWLPCLGGSSRSSDTVVGMPRYCARAQSCEAATRQLDESATGSALVLGPGLSTHCCRHLRTAAPLATVNE